MKTKLMTMILAAGAMLGAWADTHGKVQLWENGPYWAETNIGAEEPWDPGYYFWWGDTVGYKRVGSAWVASDDSVSGFSFSIENAQTYNKSPDDLLGEGGGHGGLQPCTRIRCGASTVGRRLAHADV